MICLSNELKEGPVEIFLNGEVKLQKMITFGLQIKKSMSRRERKRNRKIYNVSTNNLAICTNIEQN